MESLCGSAMEIPEFGGGRDLCHSMILELCSKLCRDAPAHATEQYSRPTQVSISKTLGIIHERHIIFSSKL